MDCVFLLIFCLDDLSFGYHCFPLLCLLAFALYVEMPISYILCAYIFLIVMASWIDPLIIM